MNSRDRGEPMPAGKAWDDCTDTAKTFWPIRAKVWNRVKKGETSWIDPGDWRELASLGL